MSRREPAQRGHIRSRATKQGLPLELAEPLQQIDRTYVLYRRRKLSYFGGCDYFRLASHPAVLNALREGLDAFGLNVSASRRTTGNHELYTRLEQALADFFKVERAVLVSSGYASNLVLGQALAGEFTHALLDERAHACLCDASQWLGCRVTFFRHRDPGAAASAARRLGRKSRILLLTDGLFSHSGEVAPLDEYLRVLPDNVNLFVDDAHGAGTLGKHGRGTVEWLGVSSNRVMQTVTLSKAFGVYGGAILGSRDLRGQIISKSRYFVGNTPPPLPLAAAALEALHVVRRDPGLRRRLILRTNYVKAALSEAGIPMPNGPGPILPIRPRDSHEAARVRRALLAAGIHPPWINYLGKPGQHYFRFALSSEHSAEQLDALVDALRSSLTTGTSPPADTAATKRGHRSDGHPQAGEKRLRHPPVRPV